MNRLDFIKRGFLALFGLLGFRAFGSPPQLRRRYGALKRKLFLTITTTSYTPSGFDPSFTISGDTVFIDYGDGTSELTNSASKIYTLAGTKIVKFYANKYPTIIDINSDSVTGYSEYNQNTLLETLYLNNNNISSEIPDISNLIRLTSLRYDNNSFTGNIKSISRNIYLVYLFLNVNALTGVIPSLSANTSLYYAYFNDNQLTGYTASTISTTLKYFQAHNNLLPVGSVNQCLVDFDTAGHAGAYTLNLGGTGNAAPSSGPPDGVTAKASLIGKGWTVTTN